MTLVSDSTSSNSEWERLSTIGSEPPILSEMAERQLVKCYSEKISILDAEVENLKAEKGEMAAENELLKDEIGELKTKVEELTKEKEKDEPSNLHPWMKAQLQDMRSFMEQWKKMSLQAYKTILELETAKEATEARSDRKSLTKSIEKLEDGCEKMVKEVKKTFAWHKSCIEH